MAKSKAVKMTLRERCAALEAENKQLRAVEIFATRLMDGRATCGYERTFDVYYGPNTYERRRVRVYEPRRTDSGWTVMHDAKTNRVIDLGSTLDIQERLRSRGPYLVEIDRWLSYLQSAQCEQNERDTAQILGKE